jgi:hypothetical protein
VAFGLSLDITKRLAFGLMSIRQLPNRFAFNGANRIAIERKGNTHGFEIENRENSQ